jgi:hypothetical protein
VSDILATGDMVHVVTRRRFAADLHSHFAGEITNVEPPLFRMVGYLFVYDPGSNTYFKHPELRTRVFSAADSGRDITILPRKVEMKSLQFEMVEGRLMLLDAKGFTLELEQFGGEG